MVEPTSGDTTRAAWVAQRRAAVVAEYDAEAPDYDAHGYPNDMQRAWVARLVDSCPADGLVLDAPCGTGLYFAMVRDAGRRVVGLDQSAGMLAQARARGIAEGLDHTGLQEIAYEEAFDGVMTIDAMENVAPEDWSVVLANLRRALRPSALLYLTVEEVDESAIDEAFEAMTRQGAPAVRGEIVEGNVAGYHYYPGRDRVVGWLDGAGLAVVDEDYAQHPGWGYRHFLLRRA